MSIIQELLVEYIRMRGNGLDSKATLRALRPYIEPLSNKNKAQLADSLRQWENNERPKSSYSQSPIKPIVSKGSRLGEDLLSKGLKPGATWVACENCHTKNKINEIFCRTCGHFIDSGQGFHNTRNFTDSDPSLVSPEHFGKESLLILKMRDSGAYFTLHPQQYSHEIVIGRSSSNSAMKPDIDLADENAEEFGVSRLHLAVQYREEEAIVMVSDLGSANGSFINGQKLHPSEERILHSGDDLRLGHMVIRVEYQHPGTEVQ